MGIHYITDNVLGVLDNTCKQAINQSTQTHMPDVPVSKQPFVWPCVDFVLTLFAPFYQDGHFENTYYSDFISNLARIKYAGESLHSMMDAVQHT